MGDAAKLRRRLARMSKKNKGARNIRNAVKGLASNHGMLQMLIDAVIEATGVEDKVKEIFTDRLNKLAEEQKGATLPPTEVLNQAAKALKSGDTTAEEVRHDVGG